MDKWRVRHRVSVLVASANGQEKGSSRGELVQLVTRGWCWLLLTNITSREEQALLLSRQLVTTEIGCIYTALLGFLSS